MKGGLALSRSGPGRFGSKWRSVDIEWRTDQGGEARSSSCYGAPLAVYEPSTSTMAMSHSDVSTHTHAPCAEPLPRIFFRALDRTDDRVAPPSERGFSGHLPRIAGSRASSHPVSDAEGNTERPFCRWAHRSRSGARRTYQRTDQRCAPDRCDRDPAIARRVGSDVPPGGTNGPIGSFGPPAAPLYSWAMLSKRVRWLRKARLTLPVGPLRCLATRTSAMPRSGESGL
jgi:hypothetical protein